MTEIASINRLQGLADLFHRLGTDPTVNIRSILETANDLLKGSCSLYNRLDDKENSLIVWSGVNLPEALCRKDSPRGHICYEATIKGQGGPVVIGNLSGSIYEKTDVNVLKFGLKAYIGHPVFLKGKVIGALAVVNVMPKCFDRDDISIITGLAAAVSLEEERQSNEKAIRESEKKFRMVFETTPDSISLSRLADGTYIAVNQGYTNLMGYSLDEIMGRTSLDMGIWQDPGDRKRMVEILEKKGCIENIKCPFRSKSGKILTGLLSARRLRFNQEDVIVSITRDITLLEQAQKSLRESEEKYRFITENICDIILMTDSEGNYTYISPSHRKILGRGDEVLGRSVFEHIHPDDLETVLNSFAEGLEAGAPCKVEYRYLHPDRGYIWLESIGQRQTGNKDDIRGLITSRDITERKLAEEVIRKSQERFKSMADLLPCTIVELDKQLKVTYVNQAGFEMFGYTEEDLKQGIEGTSLLHPLELPKATARIEKHFQGIALPAAEYKMLRKDGSEIPVLWNSTPIRSGPEVIGFRGSIMDLTALKFLQGEALKAQKIESIGTLAGGIAHDFNNLLMSLSGNLSIAKAETLEDSTLFQLIESAEQSMERAKHLTNQLLTFSKGGEPIKSVMTLHQVIKDTAKFNLSGSNIKLDLVFDDCVWPVHADKGQISQVVSNLVINAKQAMPDGGRLRITLKNRETTPDQNTLLPHGKYVCILFEDQGIGISSKHLERIFDPYFTTKQTGSGLGMAIVHSIITKHNGHIFARSELGKGAQFEILLPALASEPITDSPNRPAPEPVGGRLAAHILVMDDDPTVQDISIKMLKKLGCSTVLASNGQEAVALYREAMAGDSPIHAAIMDLTIPGGMGGLEALAEILALDPDARAIVASGYSTDPVMANFRKFGFKGFVAKPYRLRELEQALEQALKS
ncbi:MAG: PAS domain S-box protein [Pseudomonadota bacterium]